MQRRGALTNGKPAGQETQEIQSTKQKQGRQRRRMRMNQGRDVRDTRYFERVNISNFLNRRNLNIEGCHL